MIASIVSGHLSTNGRPSVKSKMEPDKRYYRLALSAAVRRDLSGAVIYARYACLLAPENEDAAKLLELCLYELGENSSGEVADDGFDQVRALAAQKKWRKAEQAARAIPHQSVRVLNIRGCLLAAAKRYAQAAGCFAAAMNKDRFNRLASAGFAAANLAATNFAATAVWRKLFWWKG
jgi:tetratricopeptide (TPR) repeat protein